MMVGDDEADPKVARILAIDADFIIELEALPGSVASHQNRLARS